MLDEAEQDRAVAHRPGSVRGFGEADGLAGQRFADVDEVAVPADQAVGLYRAGLVGLGLGGGRSTPSQRRGEGP